MLRMIKKLFLRKDESSVRERKKTRDRYIQFKGGKPTDVKVGDHTYINGLTVYSWGDFSRVGIGKYCSIADEVTFVVGGEHHKDWISTFPFYDRWQLDFNVPSTIFTKGDIFVGHDVWIGHGATILSGVSIGNGAIVGAKTVVAKDVPDYAIVVGNPARVIRYRFSEDIISTLLKIQWWDWPEERIESEQLLFQDPEGFVESFRRV